MKDVLDYYIKHTDAKFDDLDKRLDTMEKMIGELNKFKWKITGVASVVIFVIELMMKV